MQGRVSRRTRSIDHVGALPENVHPVDEDRAASSASLSRVPSNTRRAGVRHWRERNREIMRHAGDDKGVGCRLFVVALGKAVSRTTSFASSPSRRHGRHGATALLASDAQTRSRYRHTSPYLCCVINNFLDTSQRSDTRRVKA